ncbi:MAG: hypothetical protein HY223_05355 [Thaumarchaeota archaeon]|nr:hypothetical protein [Nitrososphaerota archaeon]
MANFRSKDVLAVSATVIAGLLILTTLQALSTNPILTKIAEIQDEFNTKNIEYGANVESQINLKSDLANTNNTEEKKYIQTELDDLKLQAYQLKAQTLGIENQNSQWLGQSNQLKIAQNIQALRFTVIAMIVPFALAIASEASASLNPKQNTDEMATPRGKKLLLIGGFVLLIGLTFIFSSVWF